MKHHELKMLKNSGWFFNAVQDLIIKDKVLAGHDISAGGMVTTLLEMCFPETSVGLSVDLSQLNAKDDIQLLFSEKAGILIPSSRQ